MELEINKQAITGLCHTQIPDNTSRISSLKCPGRVCSCMHAVIRKWSTWDVFTHVGNIFDSMEMSTSSNKPGTNGQVDTCRLCFNVSTVQHLLSGILNILNSGAKTAGSSLYLPILHAYIRTYYIHILYAHLSRRKNSRLRGSIRLNC